MVIYIPTQICEERTKFLFLLEQHLKQFSIKYFMCIVVQRKPFPAAHFVFITMVVKLTNLCIYNLKVC